MTRVRAGYYIWHDRNAWHLRTTTPSRESHSFTGTIISSDDVRVVREFKNEQADSISNSGQEIDFSFDTHSRIDGLDFAVGCTESVTFILKANNGSYLSQNRIYLGRHGRAKSDPFTVYRTK